MSWLEQSLELNSTDNLSTLTYKSSALQAAPACRQTDRLERDWKANSIWHVHRCSNKGQTIRQEASTRVVAALENQIENSRFWPTDLLQLLKLLKKPYCFIQMKLPVRR